MHSNTFYVKMIVSDQVAETRDACDRKEDPRALLFYIFGLVPFLTQEKYMPFKPIKQFLTYEQQLDNLTQKKKLIVHNKDFALAKLKDICYFSLIDGYKNLFYNPMTRKYYAGTTFEDIVNLYDFDKKLRMLILEYICIIEQKIRSLISYHFCEMYSENQNDYLNPNNYNNTDKNRRGIGQLIHILSNEAINNTEHTYIVYQRKTYGNVPLWVILNTLSFGQISKMYSFFKSGLQTKICINFTSITEKELSQYLKVLTHFRNVCAHNERLFSFKSRYEIPDTFLHKKMQLPKNGNHYKYGKSDLFSIVITFYYLLNKTDYNEFKTNFTQLITNFEMQTDTEKKINLLTAMGISQLPLP